MNTSPFLFFLDSIIHNHFLEIKSKFIVGISKKQDYSHPFDDGDNHLCPAEAAAAFS